MNRAQPLDALVAVGGGHLLVSRPHGVVHLYAGPLTRTGMVPKGRPPVCGAHTRRLYDRSSFPVRGDLLVCARCSARIPAVPAVRAEHLTPGSQSMAGDRARYQALNVAELYLSIRFATTEAELDECSLALQLGFTAADLAGEHSSPTGRTFSNLPALIQRRRDSIRTRPTGLRPPPLSKAQRNAAHNQVIREVEAARRTPRYRGNTNHLRTA